MSIPTRLVRVLDHLTDSTWETTARYQYGPHAEDFIKLAVIRLMAARRGRATNPVCRHSLIDDA